MCCITALGPIARKHANTRTERDLLRTPGAEPPIPTGLHYTLCYNQLLTQTEYLSSVTEIHWIQIGSVLPQNVEDPNVNGTLPITTPPATALLYVPMMQPTAVGSRKSATCRYKLRTTRQYRRANVRSKHDPCNESNNYTTDYIDSF